MKIPGGIAWPRYDPDIVASDEHAACDSAAWYLVCFLEQMRNQRCLYRFVDQALTEKEVGEASVKVNGGYNAYDERQRCAAYIKRYRSDSTETALAEQLSVTKWPKTRPTYLVSVDYTPQRRSP